MERATPQKVEEKNMSEMCCKNCGDMFGKPKSESCKYDAYNAEGKNWIKKESYKEGIDALKKAGNAKSDAEADERKKNAKKPFMKKEAMDPVDPKELKGKHKDRKDKDIDNDGDVDDTDKYLHKRRKAISKSKKKDGEGDVQMNPKLDKGSKEEQKESTIRDRLMSIWETAAQTKGATKPETMDDKIKGKGAKDMVDQPVEKDDTEEKGHKDASDAGRVTKPAPQRNGGDQVRSGDQKIVNQVVDALKGMKK